MTKLYRFQQSREFPYYEIDIEVTDIVLLSKLDEVINKTITEHYGDKE